jgi:hypothetical protein
MAIDDDARVGVSAQIQAPRWILRTPEVAPAMAMSPLIGKPSTGTVRGIPVRAPVVVSMMTGPARLPANPICHNQPTNRHEKPDSDMLSWS